MKQNFTNYIRDELITFKYAKGASAMTGREFHTYHEILFFMGGNAEFISDRLHLTLRPGKLLVIPKESYHQFLITGSQEDYHRCVFNFYDLPYLQSLIESSMRNVLILDMTRDLQYLFQKMISLSDYTASDDSAPYESTIGNPIPESLTTSTKNKIMESILTLLLTEISAKPYSEQTNHTDDSISAKGISYIDAHITGPLTIPEIARALNVSESHLAHAFKKEMSIPIHRYILKKKLILAHHKIAAGEPATNAALDCGFHDYSGFYKQYKKMFNTAPSAKENTFCPK